MSRTFSKPVAVFVMFCFVLFPNITYALPQGEQVVSGSATFDRSQTNTLTVSQATDKLIANYQSFSIGKPEAVNFLQPSASSVALNRVVGVEPSAILGRLTANGKIFLVNPNGILFGQGSVMDTAGMVASTLNISDSDFLAGRYTFYGQGGSVVNQGYISSPGGYVALLGSTVQNAGVIEANLGSVALASGDAVTLNLDPAGLISVVIDEATTQNLEDAEAAVENTGTIAADGGKVILTAKTLEGVFAKAINTTGIIEADSLNASTGEISLSSNGAVSSTGDMSAKGGTITVCTDDILSLGGNYTADSIVFDPDEVVIDSLQNVSGNTTYWATGNVTVNADVNSSNGFLEFFADATNASNDYDDGIGDFSQAVGTKISGTGDITISGNNVDINGTVETIGAAGTDVEIWIAAGLYGRSGNLNVDNATISATAVAGEGDAPGESDVSVYLWADSETDSSQGNINITDSNVTAQILDNMEEEIEGDGSAYVEIWADYDVTIDPSTVTALVEGDGSAEVWVQSGDDETFGTLTIEESTITAQVEEEGESSVHLIAGVYDESYGGDYDQEVHLSGEGIINISDSTILSSVRNPDEMGEDALVVIEAQDVTIDDSDVTAEVLWRGQARVKLIAGDYDYYHQYWVSQDRYFDGGTLDVLHTSNILASVGNSMDEWNEGAEVVLEGYDIEISGMSAVGSLSQGGGRASTLIVAGDTQEIQSENYHSQFGGSLTVDNSPISAIVSGSGSAEVELSSGEEEDTVNIVESSILSRVGGEGDAEIMISSGDIQESEVETGTQENGTYTETLIFNGGTLNIDLTDIRAEVMLIEYSEGDNYAGIEIYGGYVNIDSPSDIIAQVYGDGDAYVSLNAAAEYTQFETASRSTETEDIFTKTRNYQESTYGGELNVLDSTVLAKVESGHAEIEMVSGGAIEMPAEEFTINVIGSSITADVVQSGEAYINMRAGNTQRSETYYVDDHFENPWYYSSYNHSEEISNGEINILENSDVLAIVRGSEGDAGIRLLAGGSKQLLPSTITIDDSSLTARVVGYGHAEIEMIDGVQIGTANGSDYEYDNGEFSYYDECSSESIAGAINILNGSDVLASVGSSYDTANIEMSAADITIDDSTVTAQVEEYGEASIDIAAGSRLRHHETSQHYYEEDEYMYSREENCESFHEGTLNVLNGSALLADIGNSGTAEIDLSAGGPGMLIPETINIIGSSVTAKVENDGAAYISIEDGNFYNYDEDYTFAYVEGSDEPSTNTKNSNGHLYEGTINILDNSTILASIGSGWDSAEIELIAEDITIADSTLTAETQTWGDVYIGVNAGNWEWVNNQYQEGPYDEYDNNYEYFYGSDLTITNSTLLAQAKDSNEYYSDVELYLAGDKITVDPSVLTAKVVGDGDAWVEFDGVGYYEDIEYRDWGYGYSNYNEVENGSDGSRIDIIDSKVLAQTDHGDAEILLSTSYGAEIDNSSVIARVTGQGHAGIYMIDQYNNDYWPEFIEDIAEWISDYDDIGGPMYDYIHIVDSTVLAEAHNSELVGTAVVAIATESDITIEDSTVSAKDADDVAGVVLYAENDIDILGNSNVSAESDVFAGVLAISGDDITVEENSTVSADGGEGGGVVALLAYDNIDSLGTVQASGEFDTLGFAQDWLSDMFEIDIDTQYTYSSAALFGSLSGDITLGSVSADLVLAAALGMYYEGPQFVTLSEVVEEEGPYMPEGGSIFDADGNVSGNLLVLLARHYIGTKDAPLTTDAGILTAYSYGWGDIVIEDIGDIELGLYLPIYINTGEEEVIEGPSIVLLQEEMSEEIEGSYPALELGISVAANDGIISVVSQDDMIVNSVISPRGGVFLQSANGSIYAGHGWWPMVYQYQIDDLGYMVSGLVDDFLGFDFDPECVSGMISEAMMDLWGTPWEYYGEGYGYFSPVMVGIPQCTGPLYGPNVIAGGYSYFSTPHGTIGTQVSGMSGEVAGYVDPKVLADTGLLMAPDIDLTRYTPPGYVIFNDYGKEVSVVRTLSIEEESEEYGPMGNQIWPPKVLKDSDGNPVIFDSPNPLLVEIRMPMLKETVLESSIKMPDLSNDPLFAALPDWFDWQAAMESEAGLAGLTLEIGPANVPPVPPTPPTDTAKFIINPLKTFKAYYELLDGIRVVGIEPATPTTFFAYHPLTPTDMAAFDGIDLDVGAYDFINDNIDLKKKASSYYGITE